MDANETTAAQPGRPKVAGVRGSWSLRPGDRTTLATLAASHTDGNESMFLRRLVAAAGELEATGQLAPWLWPGGGP